MRKLLAATDKLVLLRVPSSFVDISFTLDSLICGTLPDTDPDGGALAIDIDVGKLCLLVVLNIGLLSFFNSSTE